MQNEAVVQDTATKPPPTEPAGKGTACSVQAPPLTWRAANGSPSTTPADLILYKPTAVQVPPVTQDTLGRYMPGPGLGIFWIVHPLLALAGAALSSPAPSKAALAATAAAFNTLMPAPFGRLCRILRMLDTRSAWR